MADSITPVRRRRRYLRNLCFKSVAWSKNITLGIELLACVSFTTGSKRNPLWRSGRAFAKQTEGPRFESHMGWPNVKIAVNVFLLIVALVKARWRFESFVAQW